MRQLQASELDEMILHRVEVSKTLGSSVSAIFRCVKVIAPDASDKHVNLAGLIKWCSAELFEQCGNVILLDMLGNVLVEVVILGVTGVRQGIKGGMDCRSHAPDIVATKEQVVQCAVDLPSVLRLVVALDMGPCGCLAPKGMKNRTDLLGVS